MVPEQSTVAELIEALVEGLQSHRALAGKIALASAGVAIVYAVVLFTAVARMSPDYFLLREPSAGTWRNRHPVVRLLAHVTKNIVGVLLLLAGLAMLVLPGQGALTILVALTLLDFPGKRRLTLRIVRLSHVRDAIDWIRARANQPPIRLAEPEESSPR